MHPNLEYQEASQIHSPIKTYNLSRNCLFMRDMQHRPTIPRVKAKIIFMGLYSTHPVQP